MKKYMTLLLAFSLTTSLFAQVGLNNPNPHARSILDLTANDKGLLIPRLTTVQRDALTPVLDVTAQSLLVYDTNLQGFYFYQGGNWYALNEWTKLAGSGNVSLTGNATVNGVLTATSISTGSIASTGNISAGSISTTGNISAASINVAGFSGNALVPSGGIIMWSGSPGAIPSGWALCDGGSGTPNLSGRFIVGYSSGQAAYNSIGNTGGEEYHTLDTNEMPLHSHIFQDGYFMGESGASAPSLGGVQFQGTAATGGNNPSLFTNARYLYYRNNATSSEGFSSPGENRPPYYTLAYIMKL